MLEHDTIPELKQRIAHAVAELRELATKETASRAEILAVANRLQARREPVAPSVPRRETPGLEVSV